MLAEGGQEYGFVSFFPKAGEEGLGRMLQRYARAQRYAQVIELGCEGIGTVAFVFDDVLKRFQLL